MKFVIVVDFANMFPDMPTIGDSLGISFDWFALPRVGEIFELTIEKDGFFEEVDYAIVSRVVHQVSFSSIHVICTLKHLEKSEYRQRSYEHAKEIFSLLKDNGWSKDYF